MNITLFIPDLFWPEITQPEIYQHLPRTAIEKLLSQSKVETNAAETHESWLCKQFNVTRQNDNWPIAPLMLHKDAPVLANTSKDFWMRADPVHLRLEQNHIMLANNQAFTISAQEAAELTQDINKLMQHDEYTLSALHSDRWYLCLKRPPRIQTHTLDQVTCKNINHFLPIGDEYMTWRKILNEIQMLLHEHPINQTRESRGELSINSLWFWGGGYMPETLQSTYTLIWSQHELPQALALAGKIEHIQPPIHFDDCLTTQSKGNHLIVLDALHIKAQYRDGYGWRKAFEEMEANWFLPIHTALKRRKIDYLQLITSTEDRLLNFTVTHADLWKFWLPRKSMPQFVSQH